MYGINDIEDINKAGKYLAFLSVIGAIYLLLDINFKDFIGISLININERSGVYEAIFSCLIVWFFIRYAFIYRVKWEEHLNEYINFSQIDLKESTLIKEIIRLEGCSYPWLIYIKLRSIHGHYFVNFASDRELSSYTQLQKDYKLNKITRDSTLSWIEASGKRILSAIDNKVGKDIESLLQEVIDTNRLESNDHLHGYRLSITGSKGGRNFKREIYNQAFYSIKGINDSIPLLLFAFFIGAFIGQCFN